MGKEKRGRPKNKNKKIMLHTRIDEGLHAKVQQEREESRRTLSATVETIIEFFFNSKGKGNP